MRKWELGVFRRLGFGKRYQVKRWPFIPPHLAAALSSWGSAHYRNLPWRCHRDPFALLLAEMLLRRTSGSHVAKVFPKFYRRYGTPEKLAASSLGSLSRILRPLGITSWRAAVLQEMAGYLLEHHGGRVPADPVLLERVPHVGPYTANAVACFAYGLPLPLVDVNVIRVLDRFTGRPTLGPNPHRQLSIWGKSLRSLPEEDVERYQYALLDLAASVCGRTPHCEECPLRRGCAWVGRSGI